jgi:hypothetical protein
MQTKFFVQFAPCKHKQLLGSFFSNLSYIKTTQLSMNRKAALPDIVSFEISQISAANLTYFVAAILNFRLNIIP